MEIQRFTPPFRYFLEAETGQGPWRGYRHKHQKLHLHHVRAGKVHFFGTDTRQKQKNRRFGGSVGRLRLSAVSAC